MASHVLQKIKSFFLLKSTSTGDSLLDSDAQIPDPRTAPEVSFSRPRIVALNHRKQEVIIVEPTSFAEAREVAEALKQKKSIIINMRATDKELSRRIVDFLGGISYATDGHMQKVTDFIYLFTPSHIEISTANRRVYDKDDDTLFHTAMAAS